MQFGSVSFLEFTLFSLLSSPLSRLILFLDRISSITRSAEALELGLPSHQSGTGLSIQRLPMLKSHLKIAFQRPFSDFLSQSSVSRVSEKQNLVPYLLSGAAATMRSNWVGAIMNVVVCLWGNKPVVVQSSKKNQSSPSGKKLCKLERVDAERR